MRKVECFETEMRCPSERFLGQIWGQNPAGDMIWSSKMTIIVR